MVTIHGKTDAELEKLKKAFAGIYISKMFPKLRYDVELFRGTDGNIAVRIVSVLFRGLSEEKRSSVTEDALIAFDPDITAKIKPLVLVFPKELSTSPESIAFDKSKPKGEMSDAEERRTESPSNRGSVSHLQNPIAPERT